MNNQEKPTLIFTHGWGTDSQVWEEVVGAFNGEYNIVNIDLPGHGRARTLWTDATLAPATTQISATLSASLTEDGPKIGIGWSLGAASLIKTEADNPGTFDALVLVGATPSFVIRDGFECAQPTALVKRMIKDLKGVSINTLRRFYGLNFTDEELSSNGAVRFMERYSRAYSDINPDSLVNSLNTIINSDLRADLSSLKLPVLIVHGSLDNVTPVGAAHYLNNQIDDSEIYLFDEGGHVPFLTFPDKFISRLSDFFSKYKFSL